MTAGARAMSDRRFLIALVGLLAALLGTAVAALSLVELSDPVRPSGETGAPTDVSGLLTGTTLLGLVMAVAGASVAVALLRRQLRSAD